MTVDGDVTWPDGHSPLDELIVITRRMAAPLHTDTEEYGVDALALQDQALEEVWIHEHLADREDAAGRMPDEAGYLAPRPLLLRRARPALAAGRAPLQLPAGRVPLQLPKPRRIEVTIGPKDFALTPDNVVRELRRQQRPRRSTPTRQEVGRRRQVLLDMLGDGPAATPLLAGAVNTDPKAVLGLLKKLRAEGLVKSMGGRPTVWALADQAERMEKVDEPREAARDAAAPLTGSIRDRYIDMLARHYPERLIELIESGRVPALPHILELIERSIFDEWEAEVGDAPELR
jgi:hypothetical protein